MADRFYTIAKFGDDKFGSVIEGASATGGNPIDFRVTYDVVNNNKARVIRALESITAYIIKDTWPPV